MQKDRHRMQDCILTRTTNRSASFRIVPAFTIILFAIRCLDVLVIRSDQWLGEQIVTKVFGIILIFSYAAFSSQSFRGIGFTAKKLWKSVYWGSTIILLSLFIGYAGEWLFLYVTGKNPVIYVMPEGNSLIPNSAISGGLGLGMILVLGNILNSIMEEGFFRGFLIGNLKRKLSIRAAVLIQALLFGIWHIFWPLRDFLDSKTDLTAFLVTSAVYCVAATIIGLAWGVLFTLTDNLWKAVVPHTKNNTVMNFVQIGTQAGDAYSLGIRTALLTISFLLIVLFLNAKMRPDKLYEKAGNKIPGSP